jgi:hypothetical protein
MTFTKRGTALTGDLFTVSHPSLQLSAAFTSHVDVLFDGLTHQVLSAADRGAFNYANTTGEFTIGEFRGHVIETLDTVSTQVSHRYQAVVTADNGALSTHSYQSAEQVLALIGALSPISTALGLVIDPDDTVEVVSTPKVAFATDIGLVELAPLTSEIIAQLPSWSGTAVEHGELYAGQSSDRAPWLTLVTETAQVIAMLGDNVDPDDAVTALSSLRAVWSG